MAVIRRGDWGAGPARAAIIRTPVSRLYLHHTVTPQWTGATAGRKLQGIARGRGFADISYSWLVDVDGNEIEGRGWRRQGAHTVGWNSTAHAISLIGNFDVDRPPRKMLEAVARLVRKHAEYGPGRITHGHRDVAGTACPGRYAYAQIDTINRLARGQTSSGGLTVADIDRILSNQKKILDTLGHVDTGHLHQMKDAIDVIDRNLRLLMARVGSGGRNLFDDVDEIQRAVRPGARELKRLIEELTALVERATGQQVADPPATSDTT